MKNPLLEQFLIESREILQQIGDLLIKLEEDSSPEFLNELFRLVHTLKGNSGLFEFSDMTKLLHASEDLLNRLRNQTLEYSSKIADILLEASDLVNTMLDEIEFQEGLSKSTKKLAEDMINLIRGVLSESEDKTEKASSESSKVVSIRYDYAGLPEEVRMQLVRLILEGQKIRFLIYTPEEEAFFKGEDPFYLARKTPGVLWRRVYLREKIEDPASFDIYRCILKFEMATTSDEETLKEHYQYVLEQVQFFEPSISGLIFPSGKRNGGPVYEDFVEEFRELLKKGEPTLLKNSLRAMSELTAPELFVASALRWIDLLVDYLPSSLPYIEGLLYSIETFEPPRFEVSRQITEGDSQSAGPLDISEEVYKILSTQRELLELLPEAEEETRPGIIESALLSIKRCLEAKGQTEMLQNLEKLREPEEIKSFLYGFLKVTKRESPEALEPRRTEKPEKETLSRPSSEKAGLSTRILRVSEEKVTRLMNLIGELVVAKNSLLYLSRKVETEYELSKLSKEIKLQYSVLNRLSEEMQDAIMQIRMVPVSTVFQRFPRLVRDISKKLGKEVRLVMEGEETEVDKDVIEALGDPLIHLVRNSLDHGIEPKEERIAVGKAPFGTIILRAKQEADRVVIEIEDDGRGIDPEKVKRKAYEMGLLEENILESLRKEEALNLIFLPGFSTKEEASDLSGRGVGMDVVRTTIERLNGSISVASEVGKGTVVTLFLPLSMAVSNVMLIETAGQRFGIPMESVMETVRVPKKEIHLFKGGWVTTLRGKVVPVFFLNELLGLNLPHLTNEEEEYALMVLNVRKQIVGVVVDRFLGTADIILKPLQGILSQLKIFQGTSIMGDGYVLLVINPKELILWA